MKTEEVNAGNRLLAEFMTGQKQESTVFFGLNCTASGLKYHSSWDWLIPVVEKILNICLDSDSMEPYYNITDAIPEIQSVWLACVEFVKWWNEQQE